MERRLIILLCLPWILVCQARGEDWTLSEILPSEEIAVFSEEVQDWELEIRPQGFLYHTYWASAAEPRLATHVIHESDQGGLLDSYVGGRVGLLRFGPKDRLEGFQLDILGGAKLRQDLEDGLDVLGTDFRYDILGTYAQGPHRWKFGFYHVSAHAGDELLTRDPSFERVNFFRDVLVAGYSYYPIEELRLYTEVGTAVDWEFSEPWELQFGIDYGPAGPTGLHGAPFFAFNAHLREELDFGGNFAAQAGWAWRGDSPGDGTLRTGLYFYNGGSPQFTFFRDAEQQVGWGLWYDY